MTFGHSTKTLERGFHGQTTVQVETSPNHNIHQKVDHYYNQDHSDSPVLGNFPSFNWERTTLTTSPPTIHKEALVTLGLDFPS